MSDDNCSRATTPIGYCFAYFLWERVKNEVKELYRRGLQSIFCNECVDYCNNIITQELSQINEDGESADEFNAVKNCSAALDDMLRAR